jgi:hypothetical protein
MHSINNVCRCAVDSQKCKEHATESFDVLLDDFKADWQRSAQVHCATALQARVRMFLQMPPSIATHVQPSSASSSTFVGTPAISAHEMTEITDTDIDAATLAEFPVELRAGIIAEHRAVTTN